jgi:hypothetical protein
MAKIMLALLRRDSEGDYHDYFDAAKLESSEVLAGSSSA